MTTDSRQRLARRAATALGLLLMFACAAPRSGAQAPHKTAETPPAAERLSLPGRDWALDLSLPGFVKLVDTYDREGRQRTLMAGPAARKRMMVLMVRMSPARRDGGGREFRDYVLEAAKKKGAQVSNAKSFEYGVLPLLRYGFNLWAALGVPPGPTGWGAPMGPTHRNMTAFLARDGVWVEITAFGDVGGDEEKAFYAVLDTVRFADTSAPATSFDFYHKGRSLYEAGEYAKAAEFYGRALELERRERRLDAATWRRLVEGASRAYGLTGDLGRARETAEYGLAQDPDYPLFHLLMAVIHASRDDVDATVAALQKAFANKSALPPGSRLPDPRAYAPFRHFAKDERFRRATKDMKP